eukprot:gene3260-3571_t
MGPKSRPIITFALIREKNPFLNDIEELNHLDLSYANLTQLDDTLHLLSHVQSCNLSHNQLTVVSELDVFDQLDDLDLSFNLIDQNGLLQSLQGLPRGLRRINLSASLSSSFMMPLHAESILKEIVDRKCRLQNLLPTFDLNMTIEKLNRELEEGLLQSEQHRHQQQDHFKQQLEKQSEDENKVFVKVKDGLLSEKHWREEEKRRIRGELEKEGKSSGVMALGNNGDNNNNDNDAKPGELSEKAQEILQRMRLAADKVWQDLHSRPTTVTTTTKTTSINDVSEEKLITQHNRDISVAEQKLKDDSSVDTNKDDEK